MSRQYQESEKYLQVENLLVELKKHHTRRKKAQIRAKLKGLGIKLDQYDNIMPMSKNEYNR